MIRGSMLRYYAIGLLIATVAACSSALPDRGPETRAAVQHLASFTGLNGTGDIASPQFDLFAHVYDRVRRDYVREVDGDELMAAAVEAVKNAYQPVD